MATLPAGLWGNYVIQALREHKHVSTARIYTDCVKTAGGLGWAEADGSPAKPVGSMLAKGFAKDLEDPNAMQTRCRYDRSRDLYGGSDEVAEGRVSRSRASHPRRWRWVSTLSSICLTCVERQIGPRGAP